MHTIKKRERIKFLSTIPYSLLLVSPACSSCAPKGFS